MCPEHHQMAAVDGLTHMFRPAFLSRYQRVDPGGGTALGLTFAGPVKRHRFSAASFPIHHRANRAVGHA